MISKKKQTVWGDGMAKQKKKAKTVSAVLIAAVLLSLVCFFALRSVTKSLYPLTYYDFVEKYAAQYELEESFVFAVIKCESNFQSDAVSPVGARGLMQIMPETFAWLQTKTKEELSEDMLFDEETSVKYGCFLYRILFDRFEDPQTAVAAYHAGMGIVSKWLSDEKYSKDGKTLSDIPYASTKAYVERVMKTQEIYRKLYRIKPYITITGGKEND